MLGRPLMHRRERVGEFDVRAMTKASASMIIDATGTPPSSSCAGHTAKSCWAGRPFAGRATGLPRRSKSRFPSLGSTHIAGRASANGQPSDLEYAPNAPCLPVRTAMTANDRGLSPAKKMASARTAGAIR